MKIIDFLCYAIDGRQLKRLILLPSMVVIFRDSCAGCRWKERPQKCSCCKRNKYIKDCYEDRGRDD